MSDISIIYILYEQCKKLYLKITMIISIVWVLWIGVCSMKDWSVWIDQNRHQSYSYRTSNTVHTSISVEKLPVILFIYCKEYILLSFIPLTTKFVLLHIINICSILFRINKGVLDQYLCFCCSIIILSFLSKFLK